jgi:hypothetical protein
MPISKAPRICMVSGTRDQWKRPASSPISTIQPTQSTRMIAMNSLSQGFWSR